MKNVPFTIKADLELGGRVKPYLSDQADVVIRKGGVPDTLGSSATIWDAYEVENDRFLIKIPNGLRFYIEGGESIRYDHPDDVTHREVLLFLLGSAWGALAYQRRLLPLHASGIISDGDVYAFSGMSGAGKSTLSAALSKKGHHFFSDDVLIIDPAQLDKEARCYAGQKDLKLWSDALELTGIKGKGLVRDYESFEKYYADPEQYSDLTTGQLKAIYLLTSQNERLKKDPFTVERIRGARAIKKLDNVIYRYWYGIEIVGQKTLFEWLAKLMQHIELYRYDRPVSRENFSEGVDYISQRLPVPKKSKLE